MHRGLMCGVFATLLLGACGKGSNGDHTDLPLSVRPEAGPEASGTLTETTDTPSAVEDAVPGGGEAQPTSQTCPVIDAGPACDEDAGVNLAIINPCGAPQGGGTPIARQKPPVTCRQ